MREAGFAQNSGRWGLTLSVALSFGWAGACQKASKKVCDWKDSKGLNIAGWTGENLNDKELSLIFLKGPSEVTREIGTFLDDEGIQASFFVQGAAVEAYEKNLEEMAAEGGGHLIGNGGYRFRNLTEAKEPVLELRTTDALISPLIFDDKFLFYAPEKSFNQSIATQLKHNGLGKYVGPIKDDTTPSETFRYDEDCWAQGIKPAACAQQYEAEIRRLGRGIIALHDTDPQTLELLKLLLPNIKDAGFSFKRLDQLANISAVLPLQGGDSGAHVKSCQDY